MVIFWFLLDICDVSPDPVDSSDNNDQQVHNENDSKSFVGGDTLLCKKQKEEIIKKLQIS